MATWTGYETTPAVLAQAGNWISKCLLESGSVFSDEELWTAENFADLKAMFVDNPILGKQKFYEKLTLQLEGARPEVTKLAAESFWLLLMFVGDSYFGAATKIDRIREIWELSDDELPETSVLSGDALAGVANPGPAFLTKIPDEYGFLIKLLLDWKQMSTEHRSALLNDAPWKLCDWVASHDGSNVRAFRHMFLYFCYPSYFERICSKNHKKQLYDSFAKSLELDQDFFKEDGTPCNLDRAILSIRHKLEKEFGTSEIDFYDKSLRKRWGKEDKDAKKRKPGAGKAAPPIGPNVWIEKTLVKGRPDRQSGENRVGEALWSPQRGKDNRDYYSNMRLVAPGDIVLHLTDNLGFTGKSRAAEKVDSQFVCLPDTNWAGQPGYRIQLSDYEPLEPELQRDAFFKDAEIGQDMRALLGTESGRGLFYNRNLELNQGVYLTKAPGTLVTLLNKAYRKTAGRKLVDIPDEDTPFERLEANPMQTKSLNTIFYGPPGTGKTYATAWEAVRRCLGDATASALRNDRAALMAEYRRLTSEGRIEFVTFHQSFSYEEFVEGLRPTTDTSGGEGESANMSASGGFRLEAHSGVFKRISENARLDTWNAAEQRLDRNRSVFKLSLIGNNWPQALEASLENRRMFWGFGGRVDWSAAEFDEFDAIKAHWLRDHPDASGQKADVSGTWYFRAAVENDDYVALTVGKNKIVALGKVTGTYEFLSEKEQRPHAREVEWIWSDPNGADRSTFYPERFNAFQPMYRLGDNAIDWDGLESIVFGRDALRPTAGARDYVLIIDEINRANISKVFGELITLLEPDKRLGCENEIRLRLPYSGIRFGVPANLHVVGTMNTADRSIALLDTALRRRFTFNELMPDTNALTAALAKGGHDAENLGGVNLSKLLTTINERIEYLFDREHQIGHAYFTGCRSLADVEDVMRNKVIPLLAEYFYEDWSKVAAVLGDGNGTAKARFLEAKKLSPPAGFTDDELGGEKLRWSVKAEFNFSEFEA